METRRLLKQRLAVFLSIAMALTMLLGSTPQMQTTAEAATTKRGAVMPCAASGISGAIQVDRPFPLIPEYINYFAVEEKQSVNMARLFGTSIYEKRGNEWVYKSEANLENVKGVKYSLNPTKSATIDQKGILKTKSPGVIKGTIKYGGSERHFAVKILKAGTIGTNSSKYKNVHKVVKRIHKINGKITAKNGYEFRTLAYSFKFDVYNFDKVDFSGMMHKPGSIKIDGVTYNMADMPYLVLPDIIGVYQELYAMDQFVRDNNPVGTIPSKQFKIKSISAKKNTGTVTITLKKKINAIQILAIKAGAEDTEIKNDRTGKVGFTIKDKKTGRTYYATATIKEGSNKIIANIRNMKFVTRRNYQIMSSFTLSKEQDWTKKKIFTVK